MPNTLNDATLNREEFDKLNQFQQLALSSRCAMRAQPLFWIPALLLEKNNHEKLREHIIAVDNCISIAVCRALGVSGFSNYLPSRLSTQANQAMQEAGSVEGRLKWTSGGGAGTAYSRIHQIRNTTAAAKTAEAAAAAAIGRTEDAIKAAVQAVGLNAAIYAGQETESFASRIVRIDIEKLKKSTFKKLNGCVTESLFIEPLWCECEEDPSYHYMKYALKSWLHGLKSIGLDDLAKRYESNQEWNQAYWLQAHDRILEWDKQLRETSRMKKPRVFICYAKQDKDKAEDLFTTLCTFGADPWIDKKKLVNGDEWEHEIKKAVESADAFIVCLNPGFNQIGFRQKEVRWAKEALQLRPPGRGFIIPFILEPCELPDWCKAFHAGDHSSKQSTVEELVSAVEKHCNWARINR